MGNHRCKPKFNVELSAVITRKDGTIEDLGVISTSKINSKDITEKIKKNNQKIINERNDK